MSGNVPSAVRTLMAGEGVLRLMVFPVVIGGGLTVFPEDRAKHELELTELERFSSGVVLQVYRPTS